MTELGTLGEGGPVAGGDALREAELHLQRGTLPDGRRLAEEALDAEPDAATRARAALVVGRALMATGEEPEGRRYLAEAADQVGAAEPAAAAMMWAHIGGSELRCGLMDQARSSAATSLRIAPPGAVRERVVGRVVLGAALIAAGRSAEGLEVLPSTGEVLARIDPDLDAALVGLTAGFAAIWVERYEDGLVILEGLDRRARASRSPGPLPAILAPRALLEFRWNRWSAAATAAEEALELSRRTGQSTLVPLITSILATVEAVQGRAPACRQRALGLLESGSAGSPLIRTAALSALGLLELGEGRSEASAHWFEMLSGGLPAPGRPHPAVNMWEADLAEAYIGMGQAERAAQVLDRLEARAAASGDRRAATAAMRNRAVLHPDDARAEELFDEVLALYSTSWWRFGRARTHLARGERRLAAGRSEAARDPLRQALDGFEELGARGWAARAARQLERSGGLDSGRQPPGPALTPAEVRVAMAAAMGAGLADIAAGLFLDETTAGSHLTAAMAKLGVDDPAGLVPLIGQLAHAGSLVSISGESTVEGAGSGSRTGPVPDHVRVRLLGGFAVSDRHGPADLTDGVSARAVKMVALAGKVPSEELIEQLWPDTAPELGRARLRSLLARLRRQFRPVLVRQGSWVVLADGVTVDVDVFERHAQEAQTAAATGSPAAGELARGAMALYPGELLPTDRWLDFTAAARERLRRRYLALAGVAVDDACRTGSWETAVRLIEDAIATDPYDEHLYLRAAHILAGAGRNGEARSVLRRGETALVELGFGLSPAAEELRSRLQL